MMLIATRLTHALGGRWSGHSGIAFCPAHENHRTPALSIAVGDNGALLLHCFAGCNFAMIMREIKALGYRVPNEGKTSTADRDIRRTSILHKRRAAQARAIWEESRPVVDTPVELYLRNRGISCPLPDTLLFHPDCWHGPSARRHPAMITIVEGSISTSIHRTYLLPNGTGKALIAPQKMMLGATVGGAVRLRADDNGPLVIAEGIETALSLGSGLLSAPGSIWAALSANGMAKVLLPDRVGSVIVAMDGDDAGRSAGLTLAQRADDMGWAVSLLDARDGHDWNDVLLEGGLSR